MANVASQVTYIFIKSTTTIKVKGFESGDNFGFIPATIDIDIAGVKKTENDVYFPFKKGALIKQTDLTSFGTTYSYTSLKRYEADSVTTLI